MTQKEIKRRVLEDGVSYAGRAHAQALAEFRECHHKMQNAQAALHTAGMKLNYARIRLELVKENGTD